MSEPPIIHTTKAELDTEQFWVTHIDPIARKHGMERPTMIDNGWPDDPHWHVLRLDDILARHSPADHHPGVPYLRLRRLAGLRA